MASVTVSMLLIPSQLEALFKENPIIFGTTVCYFAHVCVLQEVSGRIRLPQSRKKPELWLHQLRQLRLGISVSFQTHDTRLLGKTLSSGGF